jgi:predicted metal-binding membrane protein
MTGAIAASLARRDLILLLGALGGLVVLCWWYLIGMARGMDGMSGMNGAMGIRTWTSVDFLMMFGMWAVMMVGMMVPTAVRSVMIFAQIGARTAARGRPFVSGYWFTAGYVVIWTVFSAAATFLQWALDQAALLSPTMVSSSSYLGALLLVSAGAWQFSPVKDTCLRHCQSPATYLATHFRPGFSGAVHLGIRHGMYCLGCCWLLMGLLFVGGVMNLLWIAAITAFVLLEKLLPARVRASRMSGWGMIVAGAGYLTWGFVR